MSEDLLFATKKCCPMKVQDLIGMIEGDKNVRMRAQHRRLSENLL
jgi:hypothetical protein